MSALSLKICTTFFLPTQSWHSKEPLDSEKPVGSEHFIIPKSSQTPCLTLYEPFFKPEVLDKP